MVVLLGVLVGVIVVLFLLLFVMYRIGVETGKREREIHWQERLTGVRRTIADKQRVGIKGKVVEVFAPFLKGFPFKATEAKFIGDPIDYVVFEGLDTRKITGIHFVEVKSGDSKLSAVQKDIKKVIDEGTVGFREFRFTED